VEEYVYKIHSLGIGQLREDVRERLVRPRPNNQRSCIRLAVCGHRDRYCGFIHGYVGEDVLAGNRARRTRSAVPVAVALGVPLYSNAPALSPLSMRSWKRDEHGNGASRS